MNMNNEQRTLEGVARDLYQIFESEAVLDRETRTNEYFETLMKNDEMSGKIVSSEKYTRLSDIVKKEVLPLYETYDAKKQEVNAKKEKMNPAKYMTMTVLILEGLEAVLTLGKSLRPVLLLSTIPLEAALGYVLYRVSKASKEGSIKNAERKFFKSVKRLDEKMAVDMKYEAMQEVMDGELLHAETYSLLSKYEKPSEFWTDYKAVISKDPVSERQSEKLGKEKFEDFLKMHTSGAYSDVKRKERFHTLFVEAHKYFARKDANYIKKQLENI